MYTEDYEFFEQPLVDLQVKYIKDYDNLLDLGTSLVDLQALISGITRIHEDNAYDSIEIYNNLRPTLIDENDNRREIIKHIISNEIENISLAKLDQLSDRIDAQFAREQKSAAKRLEKVNSYPTTSRNFSKRYKDIVKLNKFSQGSLILDMTTSVVAGLVLKFIEKLIFKDGKDFNVTVNNNLVIIQNDDNTKKIVKISEYKNSEVLSKWSNALSLEEYYDTVLSSISMQDNDIESTVINLLEKLSNDKVLSKQVIYDKRGIKTLTNDIERFRGNFYDIRM